MDAPTRCTERSPCLVILLGSSEARGCVDTVCVLSELYIGEKVVVIQSVTVLWGD